jgi:ABC-type Co2+ transport system permease subunit
METEQTITFVMGCLFMLVGVLLSLVKVDRERLLKSTHSNPGLALFRFPAYRWGMVAVLFVGGTVLILIGLGKEVL